VCYDPAAAAARLLALTRDTMAQKFAIIERFHVQIFANHLLLVFDFKITCGFANLLI
jgi:hypothetical protein